MTGGNWAPAVLGLISAACWGAADFYGGLATKSTPVYRVIISSQWVSLFLLSALAIGLGEAPLPISALLLCALGGICGAIGMFALYRALAEGHMGVAAPVSAVVAAGVPVVAGVFIDGPPSLPQLIGFGLALLAVWVISRTQHGHIQWRDLGLPLLAGFSFGTFYVIIGSTAGDAVMWPLIAARIGSLAALIGFTTLTGQPRLVARSMAGIVILIGVLEVGGNACYILARQAGRLDVAAVLASFYPAFTVALAWLVLKEHRTRTQAAGLLAALAAIVLITT
jgi:drug/metabolite transporter (DMT)-like permease